MKKYDKLEIGARYNERLVEIGEKLYEGLKETYLEKDKQALCVGSWISNGSKLIIDAIEWDRTKRPLYGTWYRFDKDNPEFGYADDTDYANSILKFDNGEIRRFDEVYPFAEITHILFYPQI